MLVVHGRAGALHGPRPNPQSVRALIATDKPTEAALQASGLTGAARCQQSLAYFLA